MSVYQFLLAVEEVAQQGFLSKKEIHRLNKIKNRKAKREVTE